MMEDSENQIVESPEIHASENKESQPTQNRKRVVSEGLKVRAVIDADVVKGLLMINGGGAIALLAFLPVVLGKPEYNAMANAVLWGLLIFPAGLVFAIVYNRLRRECSHIHDLHNYRPPPGKIIGIKLKQPTVCWTSQLFMVLSLVAFIVSISVVFFGGRATLNKSPAATPQVEVSPDPAQTLE